MAHQAVSHHLCTSLSVDANPTDHAVQNMNSFKTSHVRVLSGVIPDINQSKHQIIRSSTFSFLLTVLTNVLVLPWLGFVK